jgi:hypothetical protein
MRGGQRRDELSKFSATTHPAAGLGLSGSSDSRVSPVESLVVRCRFDRALELMRDLDKTTALRYAVWSLHVGVSVADAHELGGIGGGGWCLRGSVAGLGVDLEGALLRSALWDNAAICPLPTVGLTEGPSIFGQDTPSTWIRWSGRARVAS